jgi:biopolymer transport protein ExbB/TolQ
VSAPAATLGARLADALAQVAGALQVPVLLAALAVLLLAAFEVGRYLAELWRRRRARDFDLCDLVLRAVADPGNADYYGQLAPSGFAATALVSIAGLSAAGRLAEAEHALAAYELAVQRRLDRTRILVRAGPAIGLMGTLIPLAPGLSALGDGDVATLAADLRDALSATVVGLLAGTVAFALTLTRTRMYSEDLAALERAVEALGAPSAPPQPHGIPSVGAGL